MYLFLGKAVIPTVPVVILIALYPDLFIYQTSIYSHDTINWFPQFAYFVEALASGHLPLWDPYSFSGAPFFLNLNGIGLLDPTVLLASLVSSVTDITTLDLYHYHYLARLLIIYFGSYSLFLYLKNNSFSATLSAGLMLLAFAPNAFWQNGAVVMFTYVPFIFSSVLKIVDTHSSRSSRQHLLSLTILIGISSHLYLPSYLAVFLGILSIWLIISKQLNYGKCANLVRLIGVRWIGICALVLVVLVGPFLAAVLYIVPEQGDYFSFTRHELAHTADVMIHQIPINIASVSSPSRSSWNTLVGLIFPGVDSRFFMPSALRISEQFVSVGIMPAVFVLAFLWWCQNRFKGLLVFLLAFFGLMVFGPNDLFQFLKNIPLVSGIRQIYNFFGYLLLLLFALFHISFAQKFVNTDTDNEKTIKGLVVVIVLFVAHFIALVAYVRYLGGREDLLNDEIPNFVRDQVVANGGFLVFGYSLLLMLVVAKSKWIRKTVIFAIAGYATFGVYQFNDELKPFVVWPLHDIAAGDKRQARGFGYPEIRVPTIPRHSVFWGFLPSYYRVPTAIPPYFNSYFSLSRRAYDYIRFPSFNRQTIISGIGGSRYGFFNRYTVAADGEEALELVTAMSENALKSIVVLEKMPWPEHRENLVSGYVEKENLKLESAPVFGRNQKVYEFYPHLTPMNYQEEDRYRYGPRAVDIPVQYPQLSRWIGRTKYLGFYMTLLGDLKGHHYNLMKYFPDPSIRFLNEGEDYCYLYVANYFVRHVTPGFHGSIYNTYPHQCDIWRSGEALGFSPEIQGRHTSADLPVLNKPLNGVNLAFLDEFTDIQSPSEFIQDGQIEVKNFGPNYITFEVKNKKPGLFYYADSYTKDWKVRVDGVTTEVLAANFNSKAVSLESGEHLVEFFFRPSLYFWTLGAYLFLGVPFILVVVSYRAYQFVQKKVYRNV